MLTMQPKPARRRSTRERLPDPKASRPRGVLIADDEEMIRTFLRLYFVRQGIRCWLAKNGAEAVNLFLEHEAEIALVLLDVRMPILDGPHTLAELREIDPELVCYFISGDWTPYSEEELHGGGAAGLIVKPILFEVLDQLVQQCRGNT